MGVGGFGCAAVDLEESAAARVEGERKREVKRRNVCEAEQREFEKGKGIGLGGTGRLEKDVVSCWTEVGW
jgi:hypothetical protein